MEKFNEDLNNLLKKKGSNISFFTKLKFYQLILHKNQLKNNSKKKNELNDYKLLKKYDVLKISDVNKLIVPVSENNEVIYYVHNEELFDVIYKVHLSIGHGERNRMKHEVNTKYKNIIKDMIMLYLNS
jgi:hypothetical protein